jgi:signal transduction histidine kinase
MQQEVDLRHVMSRFFDAATDAIVLLDRDYRFTFLNRRARELLSPQGDVLGTILFESFPGIVYQDSPYLSTYRRTLEEGIPGEFEAFYPDPLNLWLRVQSYPADDGLMILFRDVTQEKLAGQTLRETIAEAERQHAEIETVYRTAPIGLALFDIPDFRYLRLNDRQAAFFGLRPDQIVGKTLTEMAPIEGLRELFEQVARGEPVINYPLEGTLVTDPEEHRYWTVSYFPVYAPDGSIQAITAASLEITQQKKAQMALLESEKLAVVGRLASSIAHEINNPLESVTNLLYLARTSDDLTEVHGFLDTAERELRRASAITSQTLRFHKQSTAPRAVTPAEIFDSVLSVYHGRIVNADVTIERHDAVDRPVRCFDAEIRQVLSNLVNNALDAILDQRGRLILRSREGTNWANGEPGVFFTIADTGAGMSPHTLSRIFTPFFTTKGITGTGLGLWVSQEIVSRHRGLLHVRSNQRPDTHGTVFTLFLPFDAVTR